MSGVVVFFEYLQAFLWLIYYWFKALFGVLFVEKIKKNVQNETILITGAGLFVCFDLRENSMVSVDLLKRFGTWSRYGQTFC